MTVPDKTRKAQPVKAAKPAADIVKLTDVPIPPEPGDHVEALYALAHKSYVHALPAPLSVIPDWELGPVQVELRPEHRGHVDAYGRAFFGPGHGSLGATYKGWDGRPWREYSAAGTYSGRAYRFWCRVDDAPADETVRVPSVRDAGKVPAVTA